MKLDTDYILSILEAIEAFPRAEMPMKDLLAAIGYDEDNDDHVEKFYYHMMRIDEVALLDCSHAGNGDRDGFGFVYSNDGRRLFPPAKYELTMAGIKFLRDRPKDIFEWDV